MKMKLQDEWTEFRLLLRSVPTLTVVLFVLSVFSMNLLANKLISLPFDWLAIDCGITVSWFAFLAMDVLTKRFGPKGATQISIVATVCNLALCLLFFAVSVIPGVWSQADVPGSETVLNTALDNTFGGTWYVVLGSTVAFLVSSFVNNFSNYAIGLLFRKKPDGKCAFFLRAYLSTALGQFSDNLVFALLVSHFFFDLSLLQCVTCALTGMLVELLCEVLFSPLGYRICARWKRQNVGADYLTYRNRKEQQTHV